MHIRGEGPSGTNICDFIASYACMGRDFLNVCAVVQTGTVQEERSDVEEEGSMFVLGEGAWGMKGL